MRNTKKDIGLYAKDKKDKSDLIMLNIEAALNLIPYVGGFLATYFGELRNKKIVEHTKGCTMSKNSRPTEPSLLLMEAMRKRAIGEKYKLPGPTAQNNVVIRKKQLKTEKLRNLSIIGISPFRSNPSLISITFPPIVLKSSKKTKEKHDLTLSVALGKIPDAGFRKLNVECAKLEFSFGLFPGGTWAPYGKSALAVKAGIILDGPVCKEDGSREFEASKSLFGNPELKCKRGGNSYKDVFKRENLRRELIKKIRAEVREILGI